MSPAAPLSPAHASHFQILRSTDAWQFAQHVAQSIPSPEAVCVRHISESDGRVIVRERNAIGRAELDACDRLSVVPAESNLARAASCPVMTTRNRRMAACDRFGSARPLSWLHQLPSDRYRGGMLPRDLAGHSRKDSVRLRSSASKFSRQLPSGPCQACSRSKPLAAS